MKGDRVEVVVDAGDSIRVYDVALVEHPAEPTRRLDSDAPDGADQQPLPGLSTPPEG